MKKPPSKSSKSNLLRKIIYLILLTAFIGYFIFIIYNAVKPASDDVNFAGLEVATNIDSTIFVDNNKVGKSTASNSFLYLKISPGTRRIKVVNTANESVYYEKDIVFEKGTKAYVAWTFGVTNETSSGIVRYFVKKTATKNKIRILSNTPDVKIIVDNVENKDGVIDANQDEHNIEISKDGYLTKSIKISFDSSKTENLKYDEFDLVIEFTLFQIPFE